MVLSSLQYYQVWLQLTVTIWVSSLLPQREAAGSHSLSSPITTSTSPVVIQDGDSLRQEIQLSCHSYLNFFREKNYKVKGYFLENGNGCFYPLCLAIFEDGNYKSPYICISGKLLHGGLRRFLHCWFVRVGWNHEYFINSTFSQNKEVTCFPSHLMAVFVRFFT